MAASYVGTHGGAESASFGDTLSWTTTRTIESGEHVVVVVSVGSDAASIASVVVGSLSLALDHSPGNGDLEYWSARATAQIASGATVTVTFTIETTYKAAVGEVLAGVADTSYVRAVANNEGQFGTSIASGTSDTSPLTDDIALGSVFVYGSSSVDITAASGGYTLGGDDGADPWGLGAGGAMQAAYLVLTGDGATSTNFTIASSIDASGALVVYKASAGPGPTPADKTYFPFRVIA